MSEKWHKTDKFANYQNKIVRNNPSLDRHVLVNSFSIPLILVFDVMRMICTQVKTYDDRMIALQVVKSSFGIHLRECIGSSFPPPLPPSPTSSP